MNQGTSYERTATSAFPHSSSFGPTSPTNQLANSSTASPPQTPAHFAQSPSTTFSPVNSASFSSHTFSPSSGSHHSVQNATPTTKREMMSMSMNEEELSHTVSKDEKGKAKSGEHHHGPIGSAKKMLKSIGKGVQSAAGLPFGSSNKEKGLVISSPIRQTTTVPFEPMKNRKKFVLWERGLKDFDYDF